MTTRAEFERLVKTDPDTLTDLERAARFLYLQRTAFGGKPSGQNFGVQREGPARFDVTKLAPMLEDLHMRLTGVMIECLPYQDFIPRYDTPATLFYLDPPYFGCENYYGKDLFKRDDFEVLRNLLTGIKGKFILSLNNATEIRDIYAGFNMQEVGTRYSVRKGKTKETSELFITNH